MLTWCKFCDEVLGSFSAAPAKYAILLPREKFHATKGEGAVLETGLTNKGEGKMTFLQAMLAAFRDPKQSLGDFRAEMAALTAEDKADLRRYFEAEGTRIE